MVDEVATPSAAAELGCLDGVIAPAAEIVVPATDEGLLRGDGVFEVVRVYDGRPFALSEHFDRLERSAASLRLGREVPRAELEAEVPALLDARGGAAFDGCLRIVLTRGGRRLLLTEPLPPGPERPRLGFVTFAPNRVLDGVKSLSYAGNMLASRLARERGFDEALLVTPHGRVLEAPTSSLFWADSSGLWTPPLGEHILASITRDRVLQLGEVGERPLTTDELLAADEAFLASTTREVQSVAAIEDRDFAEAGPRTRAAAAALREKISAELG
jgi:branched-chain amino acid aminotransferase